MFFVLLLAYANAEAYSGCFNPFGEPVPTVTESSTFFAAKTNQLPSGPTTIVLNETLMKSFSPAMRQVVYWHECGHVALAHLNRGPITIFQEQEADCFGIRAAVTLGQIDLKDVPKVQAEFSALGKGDWQHLSGQSRAVNLQRCLGDNWGSCKKQYYDNLNLIEKSIPTLTQMENVCKKVGAKSPDCAEARNLSEKLNDGFMITIAALDRDCAYIVDPKFSKIISDYNTAKRWLSH